MAINTSNNKVRIISTTVSGLTTNSKFSDIKSPALVVNTSDGGVFYADGTGGTSLKQLAALPNHTHSGYATTTQLGNYLPKAGGTLTGSLTLPGNKYQATAATEYAIDMSNSDIVNLNAIYTCDTANSANEGFQFKRDNGNYDSIWAANGVFYFSPDGSPVGGGSYSNNYTVIHSGNYTSYCSSLGHTHSYLPLSGGDLTGPVKSSSYIDATYFRPSLVAGSIQSSIDGSFRTTFTGTSTQLPFISTSRTGASAQGKLLGNYAPLIAFGAGDTHGFLQVPYSSAGTIRVGGGNGDSIKWTADLIHSGNIGSQSVASATNATNAQQLSGFTKRANANDTWGTLTSANGYTPVYWVDTASSGGIGISDKNQQTYVQIDGYFYQNEGQYQVLDTNTGAAKSHSHAIGDLPTHTFSSPRDLGWSSTIGTTKIPTINTIAYWNGAHSGTSSNLQYCDRGRFGTIVTKNTGDYISAKTVIFTPAETAIGPADVLSKLGSGYALGKGIWDYAGNGYISNSTTGSISIDLAGCSVIQFGNSRVYTQLYITAPASTTTNSKTNEILLYNDHGSNYSPAWTRVLTNRNYSEYCASTGHTHSYLPLAGGTLSNTLSISSSAARLTTSSGMPTGYEYGSNNRGTKIWSNGISFCDPYQGNNANDAAWIRHIEETANTGLLEIAVGDDAANESIKFRFYNTGNTISKEVTINHLGQITAANFITDSDRRLKTNINEISSDKLSNSLNLNFVEFDYVNNDNHSAGHVAQEVKEVLPEFVHGEETETEHLSIDYTGLHSVQIKALIDENNIMKKEIKELKELIKTLINEK